jgi:hypothetical protein
MGYPTSPDGCGSCLWAVAPTALHPGLSLFSQATASLYSLVDAQCPPNNGFPSCPSGTNANGNIGVTELSPGLVGLYGRSSSVAPYNTISSLALRVPQTSRVQRLPPSAFCPPGWGWHRLRVASKEKLCS